MLYSSYVSEELDIYRCYVTMEIGSKLEFADAIDSEVPDGHVTNNNDDCLEVPL